MEIIDVITKLEKSDSFKELDGYYLAHVFKMMDSPDSWQVGYYDPKDDKMVTFDVVGDDITKNPESDIFKKPDTKVHELKKDTVKIGWKDALDIAKGMMEDNYKGQPVMKTFFILQALVDDPIYNITFLTKAFSTINIKLSAVDGNVQKHILTPLTDLANFEPGEKSKTK